MGDLKLRRSARGARHPILRLNTSDGEFTSHCIDSTADTPLSDSVLLRLSTFESRRWCLNVAGETSDVEGNAFDGSVSGPLVSYHTTPWVAVPATTIAVTNSEATTTPE
ncbi:hypothetical protein AXFE_19250 [Acidithrix ferrooxidans]|uniref:Uncharacterized protein n=1 Tax=Acidithrix ferrooxidans TaxID=1280514 RepID=A0A0D8HHE5_9ACTN|nr:hypothetical protein AXFE_19250 [Acidithrix ferrooxidans]